MDTVGGKDVASQIRENSSLGASLKEGMAHSAMLGLGESYLSPFAVFLQGTTLQIGLLASLPLLIGSILQTFAVWLTEKVKSRRNIITVSATVQAFSWLPIALLPFIIPGDYRVWALLFMAVIYQVAGSITNPPWNSLIGDIIPVEIRGSYFGYRTRFIALFTFICLILGGQILHFFELWNLTTTGYLTIFSLAMLARLVSVHYIRQLQDLPYKFQESDKFSFFQFIRRMPKSNYARFVLFFACMNFAAFLAGPFFAMYLLNDVKVSYFEYTFIIAIVTSSQFAAVYYWGKLSDRFGNRAIMSVCGLGVAVVPFLWLFTANTLVILVIQAFSGFVWAGFNLAGANFMFDAVSPPKRARCVAYQAIINSTFICLGALLGSRLAVALSDLNFLSAGVHTPESIYLRVFAISGIVRVIVLVLMLRLFKEVREVETVRSRDLIFRMTNLRPLSGFGFSVVTGFINKSGKRKKEREPI